MMDKKSPDGFCEEQVREDYEEAVSRLDLETSLSMAKLQMERMLAELLDSGLSGEEIDEALEFWGTRKNRGAIPSAVEEKKGTLLLQGVAACLREYVALSDLILEEGNNSQRKKECLGRLGMALNGLATCVLREQGASARKYHSSYVKVIYDQFISKVIKSKKVHGEGGLRSGGFNSEKERMERDLDIYTAYREALDRRSDKAYAIRCAAKRYEELRYEFKEREARTPLEDYQDSEPPKIKLSDISSSSIRSTRRILDKVEIELRDRGIIP